MELVVLNIFLAIVNAFIFFNNIVGLDKNQSFMKLLATSTTFIAMLWCGATAFTIMLGLYN